MGLPERWICDGKPSERFPLYTRGNVGEVFPWPVTPATWTLGVVQAAEPGWRDALERFGAFQLDEFSPTDTEVIGCFGGYCYLNAAVSRVLGVRTPGLTPEQVDYSFWGEMPGVPPYVGVDGDENPERTEDIQATLGWVFSSPPLTDLEADQAKMTDLRAARPDFDGMSDEEIVAWYRGLVPEMRRLFAEHLYITYCSTVPLGVIQATCTAIGQTTLAMTLVSGIGDVDSAEPSFAFWRMGRQVRGVRGPHGGVRRGRSRPPGAAASQRPPGCRRVLRRVRRVPARVRVPRSQRVGDERTVLGDGAGAAARGDRPDAAGRRRRSAPPPSGLDGHRPRGRHPRGPGGGGRRPGGPRTAGGRAGGGAGLPRRPRAHEDQHHPRSSTRSASGSGRSGTGWSSAASWAKPTSGAMLEDGEIDQFLADPEPWVDTIREREAQYELLFEIEPPFVFEGSVPPLRTWDRATAAPAWPRRARS